MATTTKQEVPAKPKTPPDKLYSGKVRVTSTEGHKGHPVSADIELGQPMTEDGVFNAFKAHHAMARRNGLKIEPVGEFPQTGWDVNQTGDRGVGEEKVGKPAPDKTK